MKLRSTILTGLLASAALACGAAAASAGTLDTVKGKGQLTCGANTSLAGFGIPDDKGQWTGLDVDVCRAIAAAVLGDSKKVKFVPLDAKNRFTALQSGEVDVLSRNTTATSSRASTLGLIFGPPDYYDGQGFMVKTKLGVNSAKDLNGASVCVQQGTTTELNLADFFRSNNMKYESVAFQSEDEALKAYDTGRCDAFTTDASGLYAERLRLANPNDNVVLPEIISREPLAPSVRQGDDQWYDVMAYTVYAMLDAEDLPAVLADADVVVYATGAEAVLQVLPEGTAAIEYRHSPDPSDVETRVLRVLDTLRQKAAAPAAEEAACE